VTPLKPRGGPEAGKQGGEATLRKYGTEFFKRAGATGRLSNGLADLQKTAVRTTEAPTVHGALPLQGGAATGARSYDHAAPDTSSFLLQLVQEGLLAASTHTRLIAAWAAQQRDYAHLGPALDTITVDQLVEVSDGELLAMGLGARDVLELRLACEADATAVADANPAITKADIERSRTQLAAQRAISDAVVQSLDDFVRPVERAIYALLPASTSQAAMTEVALQEVSGLSRGQVQRALSRLIERGWTACIANWGPAPGRANGYRRASIEESAK
jgi:hypothetical protein